MPVLWLFPRCCHEQVSLTSRRYRDRSIGSLICAVIQEQNTSLNYTGVQIEARNNRWTLCLSTNFEMMVLKKLLLATVVLGSQMGGQTRNKSKCQNMKGHRDIITRGKNMHGTI